MIQSFLEDSDQVVLMLVQVVDDVREKTIEDDQSSLNLHICVWVHESEDQVEKVLEHFFFFFEHATGDLNEKVGELLHQVFGGGLLDGGKQVGLQELFALVRESLPKGLLPLWQHCRDGPPQNNRGQGLNFQGGGWLHDDGGKVNSVFVWVSLLDFVELALSAFSGVVVMAQDSLQLSDHISHFSHLLFV